MDEFNSDTILGEFRQWRDGHNSISREDIFILFDCLLLSEPLLIKRKLYQFPSDLNLDLKGILLMENKLKGVQKSFLMNLLESGKDELGAVSLLRKTLNKFFESWDSGKIHCIGDPSEVQRVIVECSLDDVVICIDLNEAYLVSRNFIEPARLEF